MEQNSLNKYRDSDNDFLDSDDDYPVSDLKKTSYEFKQKYKQQLLKMDQYKKNIILQKEKILQSNDFYHDYMQIIVKNYYPNKKTIDQISLFNNDYIYRDDFVRSFGWSLPDKKSINLIIKFCQGSTILEISSGMGLVAKLLASRKINIIPTDNYSEKYMLESKPFLDVEKICCVDAIQKYTNIDCLMLVWPRAHVATEVVNNFKGNKIIYIGEGPGACNAGIDFFDYLEKDWHMEAHSIRKWPYINDSLYLFTKKNIVAPSVNNYLYDYFLNYLPF